MTPLLESPIGSAPSTCSRRSSARRWLPERWTFVDEIPRTSVGKYDKKTIRSRHAENAYEVVTL